MLTVDVSPKKEEVKKRQRQFLLEGAIIGGVALILALLMPFILSQFRLKLLGRFLSLCLAALGIDLIWGYTGLLSLGHGIFFALGGYGLAMYLNLQLPAGQLPEFFTLYGVTKLPLFWQPFHSLFLRLSPLLSFLVWWRVYWVI